LRSIPNVIRRGNVLHFRRAVPVELRAHLRRGELTRSLQTDSFKAAKVRSRALYIASEHLFDRVRVTPVLADDQLAGLVRDFYATVIEPLLGRCRKREIARGTWIEVFHLVYFLSGSDLRRSRPRRSGLAYLA
jgi:hypothetical protein